MNHTLLFINVLVWKMHVDIVISGQFHIYYKRCLKFIILDFLETISKLKRNFIFLQQIFYAMMMAFLKANFLKLCLPFEITNFINIIFNKQVNAYHRSHYAYFTLGIKVNVQPKSNILVNAKAKNNIKAFTLGIKLEFEIYIFKNLSKL